MRLYRSPGSFDQQKKSPVLRKPRQASVFLQVEQNTEPLLIPGKIWSFLELKAMPETKPLPNCRGKLEPVWVSEPSCIFLFSKGSSPGLPTDTGN